MSDSSPNCDASGGTDTWETIGRRAVVERIESDAREISEAFEGVAEKVRRGEELTVPDVRQLRIALATAEYHLDDVLEPLTDVDEDLRDDVAILQR